MITGRKVRTDAKLEQLTAEQKKRLLGWLEEENRTYVEVAGLVQSEFGVKVGKSAVGCFWQRHVLTRQLWEYVESAEEIGEMPEGNFAAAILKLIEMLAFAALSEREPDVRKAERLLRMKYTMERMALARERLEWEKQRAGVAGQTKPATVADRPAETADKPRTGAHGLGETGQAGGGAARVFPGYSGEKRDRARPPEVRSGSVGAPAKGKVTDRSGRKAGEAAMESVAVEPADTVVTMAAGTEAVAESTDSGEPALPHFLQLSPEGVMLKGIKMAKHFGRDTAKLEAGFARLFPGYSADNPDSIPKRTVEEELRLKIEIQKVAGLGYAYLEAELAKRAAWRAAREGGAGADAGAVEAVA
ncbi:MAG: hypothetical protein V4773_27490 [Verrucomicrobiota bacterium]